MNEALSKSSTVEELNRRYLLSASARLSRETAYRNLRPSLGTLTDYMGDLPLKTVTAERADSYSIYLSANFKRNTYRHKLAIAKGVFKYAVMLDVLEESPFASVPLPEREFTGRNIDDAIVRELLLLMPPKYRRASKLGLLTGMRRNEIVYLDWDLEVFDAFIRLPSERTKSGKERVIPIGPKVWKVLGPRGKGRVFDFCPETLTAYVVKAWHRLGKGRIRFHDFRGTALTKFFERGGDTKTAMEIFGWENESSMEPYQHITPARIKPFLEIGYRGL